MAGKKHCGAQIHIEGSNAAKADFFFAFSLFGLLNSFYLFFDRSSDLNYASKAVVVPPRNIVK